MNPYEEVQRIWHESNLELMRSCRNFFIADYTASAAAWTIIYFYYRATENLGVTLLLSVTGVMTLIYGTHWFIRYWRLRTIIRRGSGYAHKVSVEQLRAGQGAAPGSDGA